MFYEKKHLLNLERKRIGENRNYDSKNFYIDRNERSKDFEKEIYKKFFKKLKNINRYPSLDRIYLKLSSYLGINKKSLLITDGVAGGIRQLIEIFTKANKSNIIYFKPSFALYDVYADLFQVKKNIIKYDFHNNVDFNLIKSRIDKNTAIIFLPLPDNPIAKNIPKDEILLLAKYCDKTKILLVIDEVYADYSKYSLHKDCLNYKYTIVLRSFSKSFGAAGIRFGYMISSKYIMDYLNNYRQAYETNTLSILFAETLLENLGTKKRYVSEVNKSRNKIKKLLNSLNISYFNSMEGNYIFINMGSLRKKNEIVNYLKKNNIYVRDTWTDIFKTGFSITLCDITTTKKLINSIKNFYKNA